MVESSAAIAAPRASFLSLLGGALVLSLPTLVVMAIAARVGPTPLLTGGVATEAFLALGLIHQVGLARGTSHKTASPVYLVGVLILWLSSKDHYDWYLHVSMGTLVGMPVALFIWQEYLFGGGNTRPRASTLVRRLAAKSAWPSELTACKALPEVKALREALREDAEPVMVLLMHPKPQIRIAALSALEFRPAWRIGQAEAVLQTAKFADEWPVRVAAMMALANVDDPSLARTIAEYLRDPSPEVRKAAAEALLWDAGRRWPQIRDELRNGLADMRFADDKALPLSNALPSTAITDLMVWSSDKGVLGSRATLTLIAHYRRELNQNPSPEVIDDLANRIRDSWVPSSLRVEYARLLSDGDFIDVALWRSLLEQSQPSYLRLLAAGALLRQGKDDAALDALRDVSRVPNREIALQIASIVQRVLRIDMGLPIGGGLPKPQSKLAAEIAGRVIDWAAGKSIPLPDERSSRRTRISSIARQIEKSSGGIPRLRD